MMAHQPGFATLRLLDSHYEQLARCLDSVALEDVLRDADPYLFCMQRVGRVNEVVTRLLQRYTERAMAGILPELLLALRPGDLADADTTLAGILRDYWGVHLVAYMAAWDRAVNRLSLSFFREFSLEDGSIDWQSLVRARRPTGERVEGVAPDGVRGE